MNVNSRRNRRKNRNCPDGYRMQRGTCIAIPAPTPEQTYKQKDPSWEHLVPIGNLSNDPPNIQPDITTRGCAGTCTLITGQSIGCQVHNAALQSCMCDNAGSGQIISYNCYWDEPDPPNCCNGGVTCGDDEFCNDGCNCEENPAPNRCCILRFNQVTNSNGQTVPEFSPFSQKFEIYDPDYDYDPCNMAPGQTAYDMQNLCTEQQTYNSAMFQGWITSCSQSSWGDNYQCGNLAAGVYYGNGFSCSPCGSQVPSQTPECPPSEYRAGARIPRSRRRGPNINATRSSSKSPCPPKCYDPGTYGCNQGSGNIDWTDCAQGSSPGACNTGGYTGMVTLPCSCPTDNSCCDCPPEAQCQGYNCVQEERCCDSPWPDDFCRDKHNGHPNWFCHPGCTCKYAGGGSGGQSPTQQMPEYKQGGRVPKRRRR